MSESMLNEDATKHLMCARRAAELAVSQAVGC
jgi:hypothetical protein